MTEGKLLSILVTPTRQGPEGTLASPAVTGVTGRPFLPILVTPTRQGPEGTLAIPVATGVTEGRLLPILVTPTRQGPEGTLASPVATGVTEARVLPSGEDKSFQVILATLCFTSKAKATQRQIRPRKEFTKENLSELLLVAEIAAYIPRLTGNSLINYYLISHKTLPYMVLFE